jgi:hypothetical protein
MTLSRDLCNPGGGRTGPLAMTETPPDNFSLKGSSHLIWDAVSFFFAFCRELADGKQS